MRLSRFVAFCALVWMLLRSLELLSLLSFSSVDSLSEINYLQLQYKQSLGQTLETGDKFFSSLAATQIIDLTPYVFASKYMAEESWVKSYPDINIIGFPKAGTSQLFRIFAGHPRIEATNPNLKEFCVHSVTRESNESGIHLYEYRKQVQSRRKLFNSFTLLLNGCIGGGEEVLMNYKYIPSQEEKFILVFRDPADWLWSIWNFWTDAAFDNDPFTPGSWTNPSKHYRSPELFHEIIASSGKLNVFNALLSRLRTYTSSAKLLTELVEKRNILFLRNEDIDPSVILANGALKRMADFAGIEVSLFGKESSERTNCNDEKGENSLCSQTVSTGTYKLSGSRPMLEQTREIINVFCKSLCLNWLTEFGLDYPHCYNSIV